MRFLVVLSVTVAVAVGGYGGAPAAGGVGGYYVPGGDNYYSSEEDKSKRNIRKLSELDGTGVFKANVKYYHNKHGDYALISCKPNPIPNHITWILANSPKDHIHGSPVDIPDTVVLAGGINITYMAKNGRDGKWQGDDFLYSEERRFRRVGCVWSDDVESNVARVA